MPKIHEHQREDNRIVADDYLPPNSLNSILKRQIAIESLPATLPSSLQTIALEDDENALHGSTEFMLVLYPEDETQEKDTLDMMNGADTRKSSLSKREQTFSRKILFSY